MFVTLEREEGIDYICTLHDSVQTATQESALPLQHPVLVQPICLQDVPGHIPMEKKISPRVKAEQPLYDM